MFSPLAFFVGEARAVWKSIIRWHFQVLSNRALWAVCSPQAELSPFLANMFFSVTLNIPSRIRNGENNWVSSFLLCQRRCFPTTCFSWWCPVLNNKPVHCAIIVIDDKTVPLLCSEGAFITAVVHSIFGELMDFHICIEDRWQTPLHIRSEKDLDVLGDKQSYRLPYFWSLGSSQVWHSPRK